VDRTARSDEAENILKPEGKSAKKGGRKGKGGVEEGERASDL